MATGADKTKLRQEYIQNNEDSPHSSSMRHDTELNNLTGEQVKNLFENREQSYKIN